MSVERNLIISLLKLTKEVPVLTELVKKKHICLQVIMIKLLCKLQDEGLVYLKQGSVERRNRQQA